MMFGIGFGVGVGVGVGIGVGVGVGVGVWVAVGVGVLVGVGVGPQPDSTSATARAMLATKTIRFFLFTSFLLIIFCLPSYRASESKPESGPLKSTSHILYTAGPFYFRITINVQSFTPFTHGSYLTDTHGNYFIPEWEMMSSSRVNSP